jgi:hypothetical protein
MAATVHDTIRLDVELTGDLPVNEYRVTYPSLEEMPTPALVTERSLTGFLQVHRVMTGTAPLQFDNQRFEILIQTRAILEQLKSDLGRVVYFMPHLRDEADPLPYRSVKLLKSMSAQNIDPMLDWFRAAIELEDATSNIPS